MINSFGDRRTREIYDGARVRGFPASLYKAAWRELDMINNANKLQDLRVPPGNRLEALKGELEGLYSIRINEQWRIIFRWRNGFAENVQITDYH